MENKELRENQVIKIVSKFKGQKDNQVVGFYNKMKVFIADGQVKKKYTIKITKVLDTCAFGEILHADYIKIAQKDDEGNYITPE